MTERWRTRGGLWQEMARAAAPVCNDGDGPTRRVRRSVRLRFAGSLRTERAKSSRHCDAVDAIPAHDDTTELLAAQLDPRARLDSRHCAADRLTVYIDGDTALALQRRLQCIFQSFD